MMERVIKSVKTMGSFGTERGTLYNIWIEFEDGSRGLAFSQSENPPYGANDLVEVTDTGKKTQKGAPKIKVKRLTGGLGGGQAGSDYPQGEKGPSRGAYTPSSPSQDDRIMGQIAGWALECAARTKGCIDEEEAWRFVQASERLIKRMRGGHPELEGGGHGPSKKEAYDSSGEPDLSIPF